MIEELKKKGMLQRMMQGGDSFKLEDFVERVQGFSLGLRLTHWETKSFALHKAVELTQETIDCILDKVVEAYVGLSGGSRPPFCESIKADTDKDGFIDYLKNIPCHDTSILNLRDEMLQAVYKLKYLKTLS